GYPLLVEGKVVGVVALFARHAFSEDTTEVLASVADAIAQGIQRKRAESALQAGEERFRSLVQNASDTITILGADGMVRYVSPAVERMLGHRPEELTGVRMFGLVHPDDAERASGSFAEVLGKPGSSSPLEFRAPHKDGPWRHMEATLTNLLDDPGVSGVVVNARDTTERKEAEERLREAEERYRNLVEQIPAVTYIERVTDGPEEPLYTSPQIETILGYAPEEWMEGRLWPKRLHPDDRERVLAADERLEGGTDEVFDEEYRLLAKDGRVVWVRDEAVVLRDGEGKPLYWQGIMHDVTERREAEERLEYQAFHDGLTGLPNRQLFLDRLGHALARTQRRRGKRVAVVFMDLDDFKVVNDSLGHGTGDKLLVAVSERLKGCLRHEDTLARFGGDEFTVLLEDIEDPDEPMRVAKRIIDKLRDPLELDGRGLYARASIGIALGEDRTKNPEELLREADTAMYRAKAEGSGYTVFDPTMHGRAVFRLELENDLRRAVEENEFVVHYQPIVNLQTGELWGMEALVRWDHPERGILNPDEFVPLAEESGLVVPMGELVLEEACRRAKGWQEAHPQMPPLVVSVNLSARQLSRPNLAGTVFRVRDETGLAARCLALDVTETAYVRALEGNTGALARLREMGVGVSIDDFGIGYSSLAYLKRLPADAVKIDRSFVRGLGEDIEDTAIVRTVIELA
ncbi:MAG TPA: EAL domain-containing protein, partial [Rubrobacter sp.]|nr:EAL domain-containing protein [Rubrobacter sp.]